MNPLIRIIPPFLVRFFARPYVAGDSLAKAMEVSASLWKRMPVSEMPPALAEPQIDQRMTDQAREDDATADQRAQAGILGIGQRSRPVSQACQARTARIATAGWAGSM